MRQREKDKIARAAHRGAVWLDKKMPGWSRKVRRRTLDLNSTCHCILGQIEGSTSNRAFDRQVEALGLSESQTELLGFALPVDRHDAQDEDYEVLTEAWRDELKTRPR